MRRNYPQSRDVRSQESGTNLWRESRGIPRTSSMSPTEPRSPEGVARAMASLPAALFVGGVSGPLNAEATVLAEKLDPRLEEIKADLDATLELCHAGNEPSAEGWKEDVEALRSGVRSIQAMAASLLNGTFVAPRARERLHREASLSSFGPLLGTGGAQGRPSPDQEFVLEL